MQDYNKDFDQMVKEILEDAAVKPSRRVWKNVSKRLYASQESQVVSFEWMKWAGAALACAVVILGVFIFYPKHNPEEELLVLNESIPSQNSNLRAELLEEQTVSPKQDNPQSSIHIVSSVLHNIDEAISVEESTLSNTSINQNESAKQSKTRTAQLTGAGENASRYFAQMEYEDSKAAKKNDKISIYAKGALGSNDGFNSIRSSGYLAPGTASETAIKETSSSTYGIPFSFGVGARFYVLPRLSIGTGLNLNLLNRSFTGTYGAESGNVEHRLIYLGVPVNVYFDFVNFENIKFYGLVGGELEYCLSNKYIFHSTPDITKTNPVRQLQYSVSAGLGIEFSISKQFGIYLDPGIQYYFNCNQPKSVRTDRPLIFSFDAGLRFNF